MSKIVIVVFVVLIQLTLLVSNVSALDNCATVGIGYGPNWIPENSGSLELKFTVGNSYTLNTLLNKQIKLYFDKEIGPWDDWESDPIRVTGYQFSITVEDEDLLKKGSHEAKLRWQPSNDFQDFCSNITYQVGAPDKCIIDSCVPSEVPPSSSLTIKFLGKANTNYQLRFGTGGGVKDTTTDNQGQGEFSSVAIPGNNGEKVTLRIISFAPGTQSCSKDVTISSKAPPPPSCTGPVQQSGAPVPCTDSKCTTGGGKPCSDDPKNPAFVTAIGCIHTSPVEFVKDMMKFLLGISGGIAFLMMLLGAFQMLTSAGNPDTLRAGRERLTSAVIGLLMVIFAVLLLQIIGAGILNIPGFK